MTAKLALRPARADEFDYVFALHKEGLEAYIRRAWGWDEAAQRRDLRVRFDAGTFEIAEEREGSACAAVGMVALSAHADHLYLHHLIVAPDARGRGIGTALMRMVMARARMRTGAALERLSRQSGSGALRAPWLQRHRRRCASRMDGASLSGRALAALGPKGNGRSVTALTFRGRRTGSRLAGP
jgi:ribosomal protein S18 acetylase RimI-like enzyme